MQFVFYSAVRRQHQNRRFALCAAVLLANFRSRNCWQAPIEHHDIVLASLQSLERLGTVADVLHRVMLVAKPADYAVGNVCIVLDQQNLGHDSRTHELCLCIDHTRREGRPIEILWATAAILAIGLLIYLKVAVYDRFRQLKIHALKRLQGEPVAVMQGEDDFAALDSIVAALAAQRTWAMFREGKIASDADRVVCSLDEQIEFTAVGASCSTLWAYP